MVGLREPREAVSIADSRVASVDLLRGLVMIIMALDHVRSYLNFDSLVVSPTDLDHTSPALFFMRVVTHLCAPTFIFLAGMSVFFVAQRKSARDTSFFLMTRGAWLIVLQLTLIRFAWNFDPLFHFNSSNVISTIGFSMIVLAGLIHLPVRLIFLIGMVVVVGHNLLDGVRYPEGSAGEVIWSLLHVRKLYVLDHGYSFLVLYPLIPWIGVMALGYCFGHLYDAGYPMEQRKRLILLMGAGALFVFFLLRAIDGYGDPLHWRHFETTGKTVMSFFNVEKYPPSLLYLCLMLGISLTVLGLLDGKPLKFARPVVVFGKVAMFYYVLHIAVIHLVAVVAVVVSGYSWQTMIFPGSNGVANPVLKGRFGFTIAGTYLIWIGVVLLLYPVCEYWNAFKYRHRNKWWISYV